MKTIKVINKPGQLTPLIPSIVHDSAARVLTHEEPVEVYLTAFVQRRLDKGEWLEAAAPKATADEKSETSAKKGAGKKGS